MSASEIFSRFHTEAARAARATREGGVTQVRSADLVSTLPITSEECTRWDLANPPMIIRKALADARSPPRRAKRARTLYRGAVEQHASGQIFDARADALLAQAYDPGNRTYALAVVRWNEEIVRALSD